MLSLSLSSGKQPALVVVHDHFIFSGTADDDDLIFCIHFCILQELIHVAQFNLISLSIVN